jgi:phosphoribosyl 1,2-cyclic phosphodiesterase
MALRFTVLASGSGGNATLLECDGFGLLIDAGLGPRELSTRLAAAGSSWGSVQALLLTHTHTDHWHESTLAQMFRRRVPVYCHGSHRSFLAVRSHNFPLMEGSGLVHHYEPGQTFTLGPGLCCRPLRVRHDGGETFGFRVEGVPDLFGHTCAVGYVADLGTWDEELVMSLADLDLLALEFNHDVRMERASGRSARLIVRVLGDEGHLSNEQAAALLRAIVGQSSPGRLKHVVQLHLSRDCNDPSLAAAAARAALTELECDSRVHTASQNRVCPTVCVEAMPRLRRTSRRGARPPGPVVEGPRQGWLPGFENEPR